MRKDAVKAIRELLKGNARNLESIIRFLQGDDDAVRSGYVKEWAWQVLKRATLTERQKERFRRVSEGYLKRRLRREFWYMCRFIWRIPDSTFNTRVEQLTRSKDEAVRQRAALLYAYLQGPEIGARVHREFRSQYWRSTRK